MRPKETIFNRLQASSTPVSGAVLSDELGVSRVSVWKHVKAMVDSGIPIVPSPKGYFLPPDADCLVPWMFGRRQNRIHCFPEIESTMDAAMDLARRGCPDNTVVVAQRQTHGRGRMKRSWQSADGGLYFSMVVRPAIPVALASLVNLAAAVDMADLLVSSYHVDTRLKWPNDILADRHKICGILSQMETEGDLVAFMNMGIGLNVNNAPQLEEPGATSLKTLVGRSVPRWEILAGFLDRFERRMAHFEPRRVIEQWRDNNSTIGRPVRVATFTETYEGTAVDIDPRGGLVLRRLDGGLQTVNHGDCFYQ